MPSKWKFIWWGILAVWFVLAFFNVPLPHGANAVESWFDKVDAFLLGHEISPTSAGIFLGLLIGTVIAPEALQVVRDHLEVMEAKGVGTLQLPQMKVGDIAVYVRDESAWGWRMLLELNFKRLVHDQVPDEMRRAGATGRVRFVGTPRDVLKAEQLDRTYWHAATFDDGRLWDERNEYFTTPWGNAGTDRVPFYRFGTAPRIDVMRAWPRAGVLLRISVRIRLPIRKLRHLLSSADPGQPQ